MNFDSASALRQATGRAKSDVANKLVSMFLHEVSGRVCVAGGLAVSNPDYSAKVVETFGHKCLYCRKELENDRAAVEHLDGMNRFRVGLHVPGNVAMACRKCNSEKRRDDQKVHLSLGTSGWESFLEHNGSRCESGCKTCAYWIQVWPDASFRNQSLQKALDRIRQFRGQFGHFVRWSNEMKPTLKSRAEELYRACQNFATLEINRLSSELDFDFSGLHERNSR